jgi:hypothetical protein
MDAVSDRGFGAIGSRASVGGPVQAGSMSQPYGTPASSVGSTGRSFGVHTESVSGFPLAGGGRVRPDRVAVPCPAANPMRAEMHAQRVP